MLCDNCKTECARSRKEVKECMWYTQQTNADRIRAMSDEELAKWLAKTQCENVEEALQIAGVPYKVKKGIIDEVAKEALEWLKQPADK